MLKVLIQLLLCGLVAMPLTPSDASAREKGSGAGLFAGRARHLGTVRLSRPEPQEFEYDSSGPLFGLDYLWAPVGWFSVGGQLVGSQEASDEFPDTIVHGALGFQVRFWFKQVFLGYQWGRYSLAFTYESTEGDLVERVSGNGYGHGTLGGWEGDSGWFVTAQYDRFEIDAFDGTVKENGVTAVTGNTTEEGLLVYVGYRWH